MSSERAAGRERAHEGGRRQRRTGPNDRPERRRRRSGWRAKARKGERTTIGSKMDQYHLVKIDQPEGGMKGERAEMGSLGPSRSQVQRAPLTRPSLLRERTRDAPTRRSGSSRGRGSCERTFSGHAWRAMRLMRRRRMGREESRLGLGLAANTHPRSRPMPTSSDLTHAKFTHHCLRPQRLFPIAMASPSGWVMS